MAAPRSSPLREVVVAWAVAGAIALAAVIAQPHGSPEGAVGMAAGTVGHAERSEGFESHADRAATLAGIDDEVAAPRVADTPAPPVRTARASWWHGLLCRL